MKKLNFGLIILFIIIIVSNICFAQQNDNLNYFPHNDGDMWEYYYYDGPFYQDTAQVFNHFDSTDVYGNIYVTQTSRYINPISVPAVPFGDTMRYIIDTLNQVWGRVGELDSVIAFKLNAQQGDQWILRTYYDGGETAYEMARVGIIYETNIWGNIYTVMNTFYYYATNSTDTTGLTRYGVDLAKGIGIIWQGGGDSPGRMDIKGAVIGGVLYGDTTNIITSVENHIEHILPSAIKLSQNYPNPFNPTTTILYVIPDIETRHIMSIQLIVYDILGRKVATLVNKIQSPGKYSVQFNASSVSGGLPSGVYFYTLRVGNFSATKKMILMK